LRLQDRQTAGGNRAAVWWMPESATDAKQALPSEQTNNRKMQALSVFLADSAAHNMKRTVHVVHA
jgi:hypothetical protein